MNKTKKKSDEQKKNKQKKNFYLCHFLVWTVTRQFRFMR